MYLPDFINRAVTLFTDFLSIDAHEPFKTGAKIATMTGATVGVVVALTTKTYPWLRAKREGRSVSKRVGAELFQAANIERAIRYYIPPLTQSIDPAGGEESRRIHSVQSPLFTTLDNVLSPASKDRYHILLADSGMGKTSALLNYYVLNLRRWRKKRKIQIVPLGIPDADERIRKIEDKGDTILFLDALDEDTLAIDDHTKRLRVLLDATHEFQHLLITCRTQFFRKDEEIPIDTGIIKVGVRSLGESAEHDFYKIYLAPFSDQQAEAYIKRRYPIWRLRHRKLAFRLAAKIPHLTARPMLLAHINDLVQSKKNIEYSYELYEEVVVAWIKREQGFIKDATALREFSEKLAVNLFVNRAKRGAELITKDELRELAKEWGIQIQADKLSGRSLLNRDAEGNLKFAHRSIMEYLFVKRFLDGDLQCLAVEWTDQMKTFLWEMLEDRVRFSSRALVFSRWLGRYNLPLVPNLPSPLGKAGLKLLADTLKQNIEAAPLAWDDIGKYRTNAFLDLCAHVIRGDGKFDISVRIFNVSKAEKVNFMDSAYYFCQGTFWMQRDHRAMKQIFVTPAEPSLFKKLSFLLTFDEKTNFQESETLDYLRRLRAANNNPFLKPEAIVIPIIQKQILCDVLIFSSQGEASFNQEDLHRLESIFKSDDKTATSNRND